MLERKTSEILLLQRKKISLLEEFISPTFEKEWLLLKLAHCEHSSSYNRRSNHLCWRTHIWHQMLHKESNLIFHTERLSMIMMVLHRKRIKKGVVTFFYNHLDIPACTRNEAVFDGLVCDSTVTIRKKLNFQASIHQKLYHAGCCHL